jgi:hypothetical protein
MENYMEVDVRHIEDNGEKVKKVTTKLTINAMSFTEAEAKAITSKGIHSSAQAYKAKNRKLHRPCDSRWDAWMQLPGHQFGISYANYLNYRLPFEQRNQLIIKFKK